MCLACRIAAVGRPYRWMPRGSARRRDSPSGRPRRIGPHLENQFARSVDFARDDDFSAQRKPEPKRGTLDAPPRAVTARMSLEGGQKTRSERSQYLATTVT